MDSMGNKTCFVCLVAVAGSVVLFRQKKILGRILGNMFQVIRTIQEKCIRFSWEEEEEEELPHGELWLLVNRFDDLGNGKPIEQAVVVINNETLQKINKRKWVSSCLKLLPDIIEIEPPFFQVKPSLQAISSIAVCDGSSIYLLGGIYFRTNDSSCSGGKVDAYCINVTNVVSGGTKEEAQHSRQLSLMLESNRVVCAAAVTNKKEIYAFGGSEFASGDDDYDSSTFGEIYDIRDNRWMPFKEVPFKDAAQYTILGCVTWDSMIALFLQKEVEFEVGGDGGDGNNTRKYKHVTKVSYYDLKEKKWISTVVIDEDDDVEISSLCFPVLVVEDKIVFMVQSSGLYRYDLVNKCITGKIQGLKQIEELTHHHRPSDVVYLGSSSSSSSSSSDGKKYLKFCIFWEEYVYQDKFMRFAIIKVGDDDVGDKLTVRISSSVASIAVGRDYCFIKAAARLN